MATTEPYSFRVPVRDSGHVTISAQWPLTGAQWDYLMHVLEVMKPGLVKG